MSVKPELAFDVCWEVYRGAREVLETKRGISALKPEKAGKFLWRPDIRARLSEWVADFALAGQAALDEPERASRMVMFRMYYLGMAPYDTAQHFLGLSEMNGCNGAKRFGEGAGRKCCGGGCSRRESILVDLACSSTTIECVSYSRSQKSSKSIHAGARVR